MNALPSAAVLRAGGSAFVLDLRGPRPPRIVHWGNDLGPVNAEKIENLAFAALIGRGHSAFDAPVPPSITHDSGEGFFGTPAVRGHRAGTQFSNRFTLKSADVDVDRVVVECVDVDAELELTSTFIMTPQGVLQIMYSLKNLSSVDYVLDDLNIALPVSSVATQHTDFTGNWSREKSPQQRDISVGKWTRQSREGRTGHDYTLSFNAHSRDASFQRGDVWTISLGWSGNTEHFIEKLPDGTQWMGASELLLPGEVILRADETYESPTLYATYSHHGFDGSAALFHDYMRARDIHPKRPRPLTINVWEAVYFDHRFEKLSALADVAAEIGVERFVLDDGWFGERRNDLKGLGDWVVSKDVWPDGLHPLANKLKSLNIEFGLWFEPEMIQTDSDAFRANPDWILQVGNRRPGDWRSQQVIDLANDDAFNHVLNQMDAILNEYPTITYIKWDHNRVLVDASHNEKPVIRKQTLALYRLLDELKRRHPGLEIESCASGGGRIDLGILQHTDRVWVSDTNDALERQRMQRWTSQVLPPELMGSHIGPHRAHTSGRTHDLSFRAITSLFGHAGLEWDITTTTADEREILKSWASYYKKNRELLHGGRMVRVDYNEPASSLHGVVSHDQSRAIFAFVQEGVTPTSRPQPLRFPGLDTAKMYRIVEVRPAGAPRLWQIEATPWMAQGVTLSGRQLMDAGVAAPIIASEQAVLVEIRAV